MYIRLLQACHLAKVKKVAPRVRFDWAKTRCDLDTLHAVITHRFHVMGRYKTMLRKAYKAEMKKLRHAYQQHSHEEIVSFRRIKDWLHKDANELEAQQKQVLDNALKHSTHLQTIYQLRHELAAIWARSAATQEQLLKSLEEWCHRAEASGIQALQEFSRSLRCYRMA